MAVPDKVIIISSHVLLYFSRIFLFYFLASPLSYSGSLVVFYWHVSFLEMSSLNLGTFWHLWFRFQIIFVCWSTYFRFKIRKVFSSKAQSVKSRRTSFKILIGFVCHQQDQMIKINFWGSTRKSSQIVSKKFPKPPSPKSSPKSSPP